MSSWQAPQRYDEFSTVHNNETTGIRSEARTASTTVCRRRRRTGAAPVFLALPALVLELADFLPIAFLEAAFLAGAFLAGAFLDTTFFVAAFLAGAFLDGVSAP